MLAPHGLAPAAAATRAGSARPAWLAPAVLLAHAGLVALMFHSGRLRVPVATAIPLEVALLSEAEATPPRPPRLPRHQPRPLPPLPLPALPNLTEPAAEPINAARPVPPAPTFFAPSTAPAAAASTTPPRIDADYLHNPAPAYPPLSRRAREQGRVILRVTVAADGSALDVELHQSSGHPRLDAAALTAVRHWRFLPARRGEAAVVASVLVPIDFRLT